MIKRLFLVLTLVGMGWSQTGFDILSTPTDARDASLGLTLNPTVKPTRILTHPETTVTLSVWNWVADIQGAYMGIALNNVHLSFQAMNSGELEHRNDIPTEEPLSTFQYNLFNTGGAYARELGPVIVGFGGELIYERSLNASATSLALNLATAYSVNDHLQMSGGLRHFGVSGELDSESTKLPTEMWFEVDADFGQLSLMTEINNGSLPLAVGVSYSLMGKFAFMGGIQIEPADPDLRMYPSAGFTADWSNFVLGYSIYQINHTLGTRHFISLFWNY
ncbi:MAG: hypothetical protein HN995_13945 [Candidatus Marinimicrobia bacterium]|jgi:hypothetical protein|nr:hypothetical protein [Candidatus Neomarinimicrobiota bacterium]MBT3575562.1 hypothetical protein [Candidatus Neomarinimicrobiota bacterium]MBT3679659.1 hypothetical protein [Candidatus Neomarinimicrobiota bacterium]MBT3950616.1 hypothetical protein [Candidatus Neomarinimicrobiota bacterium]MBT4253397.1 hypothetical protein [Candidatus Neomarinimicrobiota bacterium]